MASMSPRVVSACVLLVILACYLHDSEAWRRRWRIRVRVRRVIPTIRGRRIVRNVGNAVRRVVSEVTDIRLRSRVRLPRLRQVLPRIRSRRVCVGLGGVGIRLGSCSVSGGGGGVLVLPPPNTNTEPTLPPVPVATNTTSVPTVNPCEQIVNRTDWSAPTIPPTQVFPFTPVGKLALYVAGVNCTTLEACKTQARELHTVSKNYNFLIGSEGTIFEGQGWNNISQHIEPYNILEYGIAFIADCFPNQRALDSVNKLVECGLFHEKIKRDLSFGDDLILRFPDCVDNFF